MNFKQIFIFLLICSTGAHSFLTAILGFAASTIWGVIEGNHKSNAQKHNQEKLVATIKEFTDYQTAKVLKSIDEAKGILTNVSTEMDHLNLKLTNLESSQQIIIYNISNISEFLRGSPLLIKWWGTKVDLAGKIDAFYRDVNRNLTQPELFAIANDVIGDNSDSVHQLIQKLHDTLFKHNEGQLFDYMMEKVSFLANNEKLPKEKLVFDMYVGVMAMELQARLTLEFQFHVYKYVNPGQAEREAIEIKKSNERIQVTKLKFGTFLKKYQTKIDKPATKDFLPVKQICLEEISADPGYIISNLTLNVTKTKDGQQLWRVDVQQSKLDARGLINGKTSKWKENAPCKNISMIYHNYFYTTMPSNVSQQFALSGISFEKQFLSFIVTAKFVSFNLDDGALKEEVRTAVEANFEPFKELSVVNSSLQATATTISGFGLFTNGNDKLTLETYKFDYSNLI